MTIICVRCVGRTRGHLGPVGRGAVVALLPLAWQKVPRVLRWFVICFIFHQDAGWRPLGHRRAGRGGAGHRSAPRAPLAQWRPPNPPPLPRVAPGCGGTWRSVLRLHPRVVHFDRPTAIPAQPAFVSSRCVKAAAACLQQCAQHSTAQRSPPGVRRGRGARLRGPSLRTEPYTPTEVPNPTFPDYLFT